MSKEKTIVALFSVDNNYDQPRNNLVAWWEKKPSFEELLKIMGGNFEYTEAIIAAADVFRGQEARFNDTDYRMETIKEGKVENE